jgi:hypothetical protein
MIPNQSQKHWLDPVLKKHLVAVEAPAAAWERVRFPQVQPVASQGHSYIWAMGAMVVMMVTAAGGHTYLKKLPNSVSNNLSNNVSNNLSNNSISHMSNSGIKLNIQSACHLCHTSEQL